MKSRAVSVDPYKSASVKYNYKSAIYFW